MRLFARKKKPLFDVARGTIDGEEVSYSFTRPVPEDIAKREFNEAAKRGLPSGSVILVP